MRYRLASLVQPSIALTAYGRPTDRMRTLPAGYNMHVPKPVDPDQLVTIIANVSGRLPGSRAAGTRW